MIEDLSLVLPLRAVVFQTLLILISIALESVILQRVLNISPKTAIQYSAILNLLSTFVGWLCFFVIQSITLNFVQIQLIRYIFFDRFVSSTAFFDLQNGFYLFVSRMIIIIIDLIVELVGLDFLLNYISEEREEIKHLISNKKIEVAENKKSRYEKDRERKLNKIKFNATFWANLSSNFLIAILILAII
ncbi:filament integrity protein FraC [Floridanema evergladense]|uniref:Filament integrity protein FraC n=1 Tax=Floridaenema evergladense BLCC-F167 TaxID=3153639 RepID=A0ABV4WQ00_9CYAN